MLQNESLLGQQFLDAASPAVLRRIIAVLNRISDVGLNQKRVMQTIVDSACELTGAQGSVIEIQEADEMVYRSTSGSLATPALGFRLNVNGSLSGLCLKSNLILACHDSETDQRVDREGCRKIGLRSMVVVPLATTTAIVGVLKVMSNSPNAFTEEDEKVLSILGGFLARSLVQAETAASRLQQFESLANSLPQLAWIANGDGWIHWYNMGWYSYTGTTPEQMEGWGWQSVHDPLELPRVLEEWKAGIESKQPVEMTFPLRGVDGDYRWFLTRVVPIKDENDKVISWFGTNTDIDAQKRVEQKLRESQERYLTLTETIPQLVWTCLPDGQCDYLSQQWVKYTGIKEEDQLGLTWLEKVIHPDDRDRTFKHWMSAVEGKHPYDIEYRIKSAKGEFRWFKTRGTPMRDDSGKISRWVGTCTDIHDQKLAAEELLRAKEEAEKANHLKSAFLANMSHEIRTPLGAMMGFADLLGDPGINSAERANYIDILHRNGEQLGRVINDILDLSKVETGHVNFEYLRVRPLQIAHEIVSLMGVVAKEKGIALSFEDDGTTPEEIVTDPTRTKQVLMNLVSNALKFTKVGSVKITLSGFEGKDGAKCCAFEVIDSGVGIPESSIERLFKMFTQADNSMTRKYGGTGLGLALSRSLARAMGGNVRLVKTEPDKGSTFHFSIESREDMLPSISDDQTLLHTKKDALLESDSLNDIRVLLVEDSPDNQQLIWRYLSKFGAHIDIADNGLEGVAKAMHGEHDIVLMDLQMPVMDGYTAVGKLRSKGYQKPIIALTAHAMSDVQKKCRDVGCTDHLPKPINPRDLVESIMKFTNKS